MLTTDQLSGIRMNVKEFLKAPPIDHFSKVVEAYERDNKETDEVYTNCVNKMNQTNLKSLNQKDVESIINPFFLEWGNMARVLGYEGCTKIATVLKEMNEELFDIRYYSLEEDLEKVSNVPELYDKIKCAQFKFNQPGSTAASKALHLIAPDFFVMWDGPIRKFYSFDDTGKEYQRFLANMKYWIDCLNPNVTSLSELFSKTKPKIIDQFNWYRLRCWW